MDEYFLYLDLETAVKEAFQLYSTAEGGRHEEDVSIATLLQWMVLHRPARPEELPRPTTAEETRQLLLRAVDGYRAKTRN